MKQLKILLTIILSLGFFIPMNAQMMHQKKDTTKTGSRQMMRRGMMGGNMMQGGMMQNMMRDGMMNQNMPMQKYMMMIKKLPMMGQALSLTESQTKQLAEMKTDFMKKKIDYRASIDKKKIDLENLLDSDASSSEIKNVMQEIANTKIDLNIHAYETSKKMKGVLNDQQKQILRNMWMNQGMMGSGMMQGGVMDDDDQN